MSWITYKLYFSGVTRKTNPLWKKRILIISQPHWGFSGDENSFVSPGFSSRLCSASLGGWASSSATNFSLAHLRFERHPWVHKWCLKMGIIDEKDTTTYFCQLLVFFYLWESKLLLCCLCTHSLTTPLLSLFVLMRVSQIWVVSLSSLPLKCEALAAPAGPGGSAVSCCAEQMRRSR